MTLLRRAVQPRTFVLALVWSMCCRPSVVVCLQQRSCLSRYSPLQRYSTPSDVENAAELQDVTASSPTTTLKAASSMILECALSDENEILKLELLKLAASYDRGFGASPTAREKAATLIRGIEQRNRAVATAATILSNSRTSPTLEGNWRLIWTTALDVLLLQASPLFSVGAIYQVFDVDTRIVTNIIDFLPRVQSLFPVGILPESLIRAKVQTRACQPAGTIVNEYPSRVGLIFESVSVKPVQVLGLDSTMLPPLAFDLPKLPGTGSSETSPGYFEVTYLDHELLIIRQNAPGGLFALLRVASTDP